MFDYFNYFTEIEERFCQRRGTVLLCSTLDWALMETWKETGIPLEAVLRGIDAAFDRYNARPSKTRKINSLGWCAQEVLAAAEEMQEAAVGAHRTPKAESGFELQSIAAYLEHNAAQLSAVVNGSAAGCPERSLQVIAGGSALDADSAAPAAAIVGKTRAATAPPAGVPESAVPVIRDSILVLRDLASGLKMVKTSPLEDLERRLTVLEEKILAALLAATADAELVACRAEADRELAPYRRKMTAAQIDHLQKQYLQKRLLEKFGIPRLSLFYM